MTDAEISLEVANIVLPNRDWIVQEYIDGRAVVSHNDHTFDSFNYTTDDALGKMAVWLAKKDNPDIGSYPSLIVADILKEPNPRIHSWGVSKLAMPHAKRNTSTA